MGLFKLIVGWQASTSGTQCFVRSIQVHGELVQCQINAEDEWLNTFVLDPGFVQTDIGNHAARTFGMQQAPTTVDESVVGMFQVLTTATKEEYGGKVVRILARFRFGD